MSLNKIKQLVKDLSEKIDNEQQVAIPVLSMKAAKYIKMYPEDKTLGALSVVFEKMAANKRLFIKKSELKDLYSKHYTNNTKFASFFSNELGEVVEEPKVKYASTYSGSVETKKEESVLSNALNYIFDNTKEIKTFSEKTASTAVNSIKKTLNNWDLKPANIKAEAGNKDILIVRADYETPKGLTSFYIPVSTSDNKISDVTTFIGTAGLEQLSFNSVKNYIMKSAGVKIKVTASDILNLFENKKQISQAELALIRVNASRANLNQPAPNSILGQKLDPLPVQDVILPKHKDVGLFTEKFASVNGEAEFLFKDNVKIAKDYIFREMLSLGYKNPQVKLIKVNSSTIYYGVSAANLAFTVPVKVENDKINIPKVVLSNGKVASFTSEGLASLSADNTVSVKMSNAYGLNPGALIVEIKKAVADNNMPKAEDCLNVLKSTGTNQEYILGLKAFIATDLKEEVRGCSMVVKSSTTKKDICGHTGMPVDKVFQDKYGNCQLLYRQGMDELNKK